MTADPGVAQVPTTAPSRDPYAGYEVWKGWDRPFAFGPEEAAYFAGETRGLAIAGADVLEIGYGSGSFLAWARRLGARTAGTEINPVLLDAGRSAGIELLPPDIESIADAHGARFDTIAAFDVFEHFPVPAIAARLGAAAAMLRPGGHLVMRFPNAQSPFGLAPQNGDVTHAASLSRSVVEQLIRGMPFEVLRYGPAFRIGGGPPMTRLARRLRGFARDLLGQALNAIYSQSIPWDPVVVLVLRRLPPAPATRP